MDMRTIVLSYIISNTICAAVIASLWVQNRKRFAGLGFWLADFVMQMVTIALVSLRGIVPDFMSIVVSNALMILGTILLYVGLERFVEKRGPQIHNAILLVIFILVHIYFAFIQPSLALRDINISLGLLAICSQIAWLMLHRADAEMRPITRGVGYVMIVFCVISAARIGVELAVPPENDFFHSNIFETITIQMYQMVFVILTFSLSLIVNRRLFADLERDIIERQRAEEALRLSEEKFSTAFHSSPDAILISRLSDGHLVEVNEGFCRITEYSYEEALSSSTIILRLWADPQDREQYVSAVLEHHSIHEMEYDFRAKSGRIVHSLCSGEIIHLGNEAHILSVVRDITERKQAEETLRQTNAELRARNEELDAFGHTVAHDLKNPLSNIIGSSYLLSDRENPLLEEDAYRMARTIQQMSLRMDRIIEELMLLAGLRKADVKMSPLTMAHIIAEILSRLASQIEETRAEIACPASWPEAVGYAPWVEEVWVNYITNAIKYGGAPPHIELGATQEADTIRFWIHDNGPGLTPEEQSRLFSPFERLEQTRLEGHGLGLSIVRRIVEKMGGQVSVNSARTAGEGTTFSFTLPAAHRAH
jgi:PAS domain S-box-containing protein